MGYGGKVAEQQRARELRAQSWTLQDIATELGVSKSSVSLWVRDVEFEPNPRRFKRRPGPRRPSSLHLRKLAEIEQCRVDGIEVIGELTSRELLLTGLALYVGEGFKDHDVGMANTDPRVLLFFVTWLRQCFEIDESRLRVRVYLHEHLDLEAAEEFWSELLSIPRSQFTKPYRAEANPSRRTSKHVYGCPAVRIGSSSLHRRIMGMADALVSLPSIPG